MPVIRQITIHNFRSIRQLTWQPAPGLNCLVGHGDSGKSTVLDAIELVLSPARRQIGLTDADVFTSSTCGKASQSR
ncbi:MAG: AAA family ATPase [Terriglobales bacterium]